MIDTDVVIATPAQANAFLDSQRQRHKPYRVARFVVSIVSPAGYIHAEAFREVAESVAFGLHALGHDVVLRGQLPSPEDRRTPIVFGWNLLPFFPAAERPRLPPDAILYNLEQIFVGSPWLAADVMDELLALLRAHRVWDYSEANVRALAALGVRAELVPIGYVPELTRIPPAPTRDVDVLFVGTLMPRRRAVLDALAQRGFVARGLFGFYGATRDAWIARAKIVLNMHMYDAKVFEIVRVSYLLANRCCVISERGSNPDEERPWEDGVAFVPYESLFDTVLRYLGDEPARAALAQRGFELIARQSVVPGLSAALARTS